MSKNKLYITLILLLTLAFSTKAIANLTLGTTSVTSNGALTLTTSSSTLVLPTTNGTNGQVLTTNGSGATSWTTVSGGGLTCTSCMTNVIPKFNGTNFENSRISDSSGTIVIGDSSFNSTVSLVTGNGVDQGMQVNVDGSSSTITLSDSGNFNNTSFVLDDGNRRINLNATNGVFINGVKKYVALLTQSGTDAPVATVLENTLGGTVVWIRSGPGSYQITNPSLLSLNKTVGFFTGSLAAGLYQVSVTDDEGIRFDVISREPDTGIAVDDVLNGQIEIRVYP